MKLSFLINPRSGGGRGLAYLEQLNKLHSEGLLEAEVANVDENISSLVLNKLLRNDRLVIIGGDGTVSRIVSQIVNSTNKSELERDNFAFCVIPLGTGNDLTRELNIRRISYNLNLLNTLQYFATGKIVRYDVFQLHREKISSIPEMFINYLSIGFDGEVIAAFDKARYRSGLLFSLGVFGNRVRYMWESSKRMGYRLNLDRVRIYGDRQELRIPSFCKSIILSNIRSIMGIGVSNKISNPCDGKLECVISRSIFDYFRMILSNISLLRSPLPLGSFKEIRIEGLDPEISFQMDGEPCGKLNSSWCQVNRITSVPFVMV